MSFVIWYQVEIEEEKPVGSLAASGATPPGQGLPVKLSNSFLTGDFVLDADITVTMTAGDSADSFEIILSDLPEQIADLLKDKQAEGARSDPARPLTVRIHLGYMDEPSTLTGSQPVLEGKVTLIKSIVGDDGINRTVMCGQEIGGYRLRTRCVAVGKAQQSNADEFVAEIAKQAGVNVAAGARLNLPLKDFTLKTGNALQALRAITDLANSPLVVRDKTIYFGAAVGNTKDPCPVAFTPDTNIVRLNEFQENDVLVADCPTQLPRIQVDMTVLGHPGLRVGQVATVKSGEPVPRGTLRINQLVHRFSTRSGYTCEARLVLAEPGQPARTTMGVQGLIDRVRTVVESTQSQHPALDMGQIKAYTPGKQQQHRATLDYGQSPPVDAVAPSVETPVDQIVQLHNKPIASPFAFHQCGLIVPIYPHMRALLAHNCGRVNDAIVAGFVWPEDPAHARPKNEAGDYWLCLPTELSRDGLPTGKGANDLTDRSGCRVIQVKAFQLLVADDGLPAVGARPTTPEAGTLVIEHQSGARITIDQDGKITIETKSQELALTNGSVTLALNGSKVEVK